MSKILSSSAPGAIAQAAAVLREGGLVAFPTETVYGLGADALNPRAVARIFEAKGRPRFDPLIVHVASDDQLGELVADLPPQAKALAERYWPGPLTLVLPKKEMVPDIVTAGLSTVAVRIPAHPVALGLIREVKKPIAAPSANRFGKISPTCAADVEQELGDSVDLILDGGRCHVGVESTVIAFTEIRPLLLRPGGVGVEEIEAIVGPVEFFQRTEGRPLSPGRLPTHYAPRTPLAIWSGDHVSSAGRRIGLLTLRPRPNLEGFAVVEVLSDSGDLKEAAANLFAAMRRLDRLGLDLILAELVPDQGIGLAINDRLRRASAGFK
jgi:L-threonylcarbamoyladenylate synthase